MDNSKNEAIPSAEAIVNVVEAIEVTLSTPGAVFTVVLSRLEAEKLALTISRALLKSSLIR